MKYWWPISLNSQWCTAPGTDLFLKLSHFVGRRHNLIDFNQCISISLDAFFLKVYFHCGTQTICWLDWTKGAFRNLVTLLVCFISILRPTQPVYAFGTPGAASEGGQCTTAGCVQRNVTKHRALNWGWNDFFWAGQQPSLIIPRTPEPRNTALLNVPFLISLNTKTTTTTTNPGLTGSSQIDTSSLLCMLLQGLFEVSWGPESSQIKHRHQSSVHCN